MRGKNDGYKLIERITIETVKEYQAKFLGLASSKRMIFGVYLSLTLLMIFPSV